MTGRKAALVLMFIAAHFSFAQPVRADEGETAKQRLAVIFILSERLVELKGVAGGEKYSTELTGFANAFEQAVVSEVAATGQYELVPEQGARELFVAQRKRAEGRKNKFDIEPVLDHLSQLDVDRLVVIESQDISASWMAGGLYFTSTTPALSVLRWSRRSYLTAIFATYTTAYVVSGEQGRVRGEKKALSVKLDHEIWPKDDVEMSTESAAALVESVLPFAVPVAIDAMCKREVLEFEETRKLDKRVLGKTKNVCIPIAAD